MSQTRSQLDEQRLCPACGYDVRASTTGRCPECGTHVGRGSASRLPWVHRRHQGGRRAFFATIALLILFPARFAAELTRRLDRAEARRFFWESLSLATVLLSAALTVSFLMRGPRLERLVFPVLTWMGTDRNPGLPAGPLYVLVEGLWVVLPLLVSVWLSLQLTMAMYRGMLWWAAGREGNPWMRRRAVVLGLYAGGLMPVAGTLLGGLLICISARFDVAVDAAWWWQWLVTAGLWLLPLASAWVLVVPTAVILGRLGMPRIRGLMLAGLFAVLQIGLWFAMAIVVFWTLGYLGVMAWSIVH